MRFALAAVFVLSVSPAMAGTWAEDDAEIAACFATMDKDPALALVNAKFARRAPSPAQLADRSFVSEAEADALRLRIAKTRPCRELRLAAVRTHHPLLEPAYTTLYYQADQVFEYLIQGYVSYGAANALAQTSLAAFDERSKAYFKAKSDAARQALSAAWLDVLQRAHSDPPPSAPHPVTCHWREINIECN